MLTQNKRLAGILLIVALLLLIPVIGVLFLEGWKWSLFDFAVAAVLLSGTGLLCELVLRKVKKTKHRVLICGAILLALFLVWVELAVGLFGTPFAGS